MGIRAVFFDVGGVVVHADLERYAVEAAPYFQAAPEHVRQEVMARAPHLERGFAPSDTFWQEVGQNLADWGLGRAASPEVCRDLWTRLMMASLRIDWAVIHLCHRLAARGLVVGALSNTIAEHAAYLRRLGVYRPFDPCVLSCEVGYRKPEREIYLLACEQAGFKPRDCLLIDDVQGNLDGAREAGMQGCLYTGLDELRQQLRRLRLPA